MMFHDALYFIIVTFRYYCRSGGNDRGRWPTCFFIAANHVTAKIFVDDL